jgi:hypothetical protein
MCQPDIQSPPDHGDFPATPDAWTATVAMPCSDTVDGYFQDQRTGDQYVSTDIELQSGSGIPADPYIWVITFDHDSDIDTDHPLVLHATDTVTGEDSSVSETASQPGFFSGSPKASPQREPKAGLADGNQPTIRFDPLPTMPPTTGTYPLTVHVTLPPGTTQPAHLFLRRTSAGGELASEHRRLPPVAEEQTVRFRKVDFSLWGSAHLYVVLGQPAGLVTKQQLGQHFQPSPSAYLRIK